MTTRTRRAATNIGCILTIAAALLWAAWAIDKAVDVAQPLNAPQSQTTGGPDPDDPMPPPPSRRSRR